MNTYFDDLKVIELAGVLAGPQAGMFFAELGATVIKVENALTGGDVTRGWRAPGERAHGYSAYYASTNYGKQVWMCDLSKDRERQALHREISTADIVLSNYSKRVATKLQMDYTTLRQLNDQLIYLQLDGFEHSERPAYDIALQAETGWIAMNGSPGMPARLPVALIDLVAGHQLKEAALLALLKRAQQRQGSYVRLSLERASLASLANQASAVLMHGGTAEPLGTLHPHIAPYGELVRSADARQLVLAVGSEAQFASLWGWLFPSQAIPAQYASNTARLAHRSELKGALEEAFSRKTAAEAVAALQALSIPYGEVKHLSEVVQGATARQMTLRDSSEGVENARLGTIAFDCDFLENCKYNESSN